MGCQLFVRRPLPLCDRGIGARELGKPHQIFGVLGNAQASFQMLCSRFSSISSRETAPEGGEAAIWRTSWVSSISSRIGEYL